MYRWLIRPECDLTYDNQLRVMLWSAVATGDARLAAQALGRRPAAPTSTSWVTYVRCHDDIGWAVSDIDAAAVGLDGHVHRGLAVRVYDTSTGALLDTFDTVGTGSGNLIVRGRLMSLSPNG